MGSKWFRLGMLAAGCVLLVAGGRLFYLIYCGDLAPEASPFPERVLRPPGGREHPLPAAAIPPSGGDSSAAFPGGAVSPPASPAPGPLSIVTGQLPMGVVGVEYSQSLEASGVRGPIAWTLAGGELPPGLTLFRRGVISGIPEEAGEWRFTVRLAEPGGPRARREFRLLVREASEEGREELKIVTESLPPGRLGRDYLQELAAEGGKPPYRWHLEGGMLPEGIRLGPDSGAVSGIPREVGDFRFSVGTVDQEEASAQRDYTLKIEEEDVEIVTAALPPAVKGERYILTLRARGGVVPYAWEIVTGRLPEGLRFDRDRGIISGIPVKWEKTEFLVRVTDRQGRSTEKEFGLEVTTDYDLAVDYGGLRIVTGTLPNGVRGQVYAARLEAAGGVEPYVWTVSAGELPPSLFLDAGTGELGGIPEKIGKTVFTVMVSDARSRTARQEFSLAVNLQLVYITTGSLDVAVAGEDYAFVIEATGGSPPYAFSLVEGELPAGLALSSGGLLQGVVSDSYFGPGPREFVFRVRAEDQAGRYDIAELRLNVRATAEPTPLSSPTPFSSPSPAPTPAESPEGLRITTGSLPRGSVGVDYRAELEAAGGTEPYSWSFAGLAEGLSGTSGGVISGRPAAAAEYEVEVAVTDGEAATDRKTLTLTIEGVEGVMEVIAAPGDGKAGLAWVNPSGDDFREVRVIRKTGGYPDGPGDGAEVYEGSGTNIVDSPLENDREYFYAVVAYREDGYPAAVGEGCLVRVTPRAVSLFGQPDPCADEVISFFPLGSSSQNETAAVGPPRGGGAFQGSLDVVSLHARARGDGSPPYGGSITLRFTDNIAADGDGDDFTVFENPFLIQPGNQPGADAVRFMEPGIVSVSQDGKIWKEFPFNYRPSYFENGDVNCFNPWSYSYGFAGISPVYSNNGSPDPTNPAVSGGDSFDLDDLPGKPFTWIQYVRITSTGDRWLIDVDGDPVRHTEEFGALSGAGSSGFDLDAVCAVNY